MAPNKLSSTSPIQGTPNLKVGDFWSWAYSDILSNRNRSICAEFIVASALGVTVKPRIEWDAVDLYYQGKKIEVKSAAYIQSWQQTRPSAIRFDVSLKRPWYSDTNTYAEKATRASDCYVFGLFAEKDPA